MSLSLNYPTTGPSLMLDFANSGVLDPRITFTRASTATYFDASGTLQSAATDAPRFDFNPSTLAAQGLLIEEARTNSIRNNTMQGAVAGTPGTLPTNWTGGTTVDGLAREIVSASVQNGITYVDIRYSGTSGALGNSTLVTQESNTQISAANAQTWTASAYVSLVGGSLANVTSLNIAIRYNDAAGASLTNQNVAITPTASATRVTNTFTAANASTAFVNMSFVANFADNSAVDFTLRIGLPQLEQGAFATSVIPTTTTALTRSADVAFTPVGAWFNSAAGTLFSEYVNVTTATGSLFAFDDGTANNRIIQFTNLGTTPTGRVVTGGVEQVSLGAGVVTVNTIGKFAFAYATNDFAVSVNGAPVGTDTSGTVPTGMTTARLGVNVVAAAALNGYLRRLSYYPVRLSNVQLQAITST